MQPVDPSTVDLRTLNRELDRTKSEVFLKHETAAFLGSIMSTLEFIWSREIPTAGTDGINLWWSPDYFQRLPRASRKTDLMHELWHVARLHMIRRGARDPALWNIACDIVIDLSLEDEGFTFEGIQGVLTWPNLDARQYKGRAEEEIYDELSKNGFQPPPGYQPDMQPPPSNKKQQVINTVVTAVQQAKMSGAGNVPGGIAELVEQFLKPVIPWQNVLQRWFSEMLDEDYSWSRPNRRYEDMYLPSRRLEAGRLENLRWYLDVSGSIRMSDAVRFRSELKFVKETYKPEKLSVVQFDTKIQRVDTWGEDDPFDKLEIHGRGGTNLECVRRDMLEEKPTAAIIFSDMECNPMDPTGLKDIPVLWVMLPSRRGHTPTFGDCVVIQE